MGLFCAVTGASSGKGKQVNCSVPCSYVETTVLKELERIKGQQKPNQIESADAPLGFSTAKDVSELIQFLLSPESTKNFGTCARINGGKYCSHF